MAHSSTKLGFKLIGTSRDVALFRDWLSKADIEGVWERYRTDVHNTHPADNGTPEAPSPIETISQITADRWSAVIAGESTQLEVATLVGRLEKRRNDIVTAALAFSEIEFAHIIGPSKPMFVLARRAIAASHGRLRLRPSSDNRGNSLENPWPALEKANKIPLDTEGIACDALRVCLLASADRITTLAPYIYEARDIEGARQMRIALRRFRSIERVFRKATKSKRLRGLAEQAKWFARIIGEARDWDVFIDETLPQFVSGPEAIGVKAIEKRAEAFRSASWEKASRAVASEAFSLFVFDVYRFGAIHNWRKTARIELFEPLNVFAMRALDRRLRKAILMGQDLDPAEPAAGHPIRLEIKKLRYAAQTFRDLYPKNIRKPYFRTMSDLQDGFGTLNDAVVAQRLAAEAAEGQGAPAMRAAAMIRQYRREEALRALEQIEQGWRTFVASTPFWRLEDEKPKSLIERLIARSENDPC